MVRQPGARPALAPDWEAATNAQMGVKSASMPGERGTPAYPHIVWHIMLDQPGTDRTSTRGQRINALYDGINDTEGANDPPGALDGGQQPGATTNSQGWYDPNHSAEATDFRYFDQPASTRVGGSDAASSESSL